MNFKRITSSTSAVLTGRYRIMKVRIVAGTDAATAVLFDKLTYGSAGDAEDFCKISAKAANDNDKENFGNDEGVQTSLGLSVLVTGTTPCVYIYFI